MTITLTISGLLGGLAWSGCSSTQHSPAPEPETPQKPVAAAASSPDPEPERRIRLSLRHAIFKRELDEDGDENEFDSLSRDWDIPDPFGSSTIEINYGGDDIELTMGSESTWHVYERATRYAIYDRLTDDEGDRRMMQRPEFPVSLSYAFPRGGRSWHALANHELISSARISLDNIMGAILYEIGNRNGLNDSRTYRSVALFLQFAEMLATSRFGHEFAHGFDSTVRNKRRLPIEGLLYAISDSGEQISYEDLMLSQAAGLNHSEGMALRYWGQSETRGNIVAALGFFLSRNDALIQWIYGFVINDGDPEFVHQQRLQAISGIRQQHRKTLDDFEEDFENNEIQPEETLDPAIYQVTGHGDIVAYIKLLEVLGYGKAHRDKDLGIFLGTNFATAYFWQAIWEIIQYIDNGKQVHERWRLLGPMEYPVFSTFRLTRGYLTQLRLPIVIDYDESPVDRVTLVGGHDLDNVLGDLNTRQLGLEVSGQLPGILENIRWSVSGVCTFDNHWRYQGNVFRGSLSYDIGPASLSLTLSHHDDDPLEDQVHLNENGFLLEAGIQWTFGGEPRRRMPQPMRPNRPPIIIARN